MNEVVIRVAPAELIDRLTRLMAQAETDDAAARQFDVQKQIADLQKAANQVLPSPDALGGLWAKLAQINAELMVLRTDIRACEARGDYGPSFVALARAIFAIKDERDQIKAQINQVLEMATFEALGSRH